MHDKKEINLFVPGRLCLIGEHSDWTFEYKSQNKDLVPGYTIATGIDLGIYATVKKSDVFIFSMDDKEFVSNIDLDSLQKEATSESFYSYICGTALHMIRKYNVSGINVKIKYVTLPIKKGLSSSAAICVLIVRAFNELYNLNLNLYNQMEDAYYGERLALSQCGKLDQICTYGNNLCLTTYYEDCLSINPIQVKEDLNWIVADLKASKDTRKILKDLHSCYPFAKNKQQAKIHDMLGIKNEEMIKELILALEEGNKKKIGKILTDNQKLIDSSAISICSEYKAPVLHEVLNDEVVKSLTYGGKGVGSGGDGSVQFLAKDKNCQQKLVTYLNEAKKIDAFGFDIKKKHIIKKAIIPVAGFGTRLYPLTRSIKKSFMPINDGKVMKPIILKLVEELDEAGIEKICLVIGNDEYEQYNDFFKKSLKDEHLKALNEEQKQYEFNILRIGEKIEYVIQDEQLGFGHAVYQCKNFIGNDPVLMILGDTYYKSNIKDSCITQILDYYDRVKSSIISIGEIDDREISNVGIICGFWDNQDKTEMTVTKIVEKPNIQYAKENLIVDSKCYGNFGQWIINKDIIDKIEYNITNKIKTKGEYSFVDILAEYVSEGNIKAYKINGITYDVGNFKSYQNTLLRSLEEDKNIVNSLNEINDLGLLNKIKELIENNKK